MCKSFVVEVCGLEPERDETLHEFEAVGELRKFLRNTSMSFADHLADIKHCYPEHELNALGSEYRGVGYVARIRNSMGAELSLGVAPNH